MGSSEVDISEIRRPPEGPASAVLAEARKTVAMARATPRKDRVDGQRRDRGRRTSHPRLVEAIFQRGEIVAGRFRVLRLTAAGGMSEVYLAEDLELHTQVALKTVLPEAGDSGIVMARLRQEVQLARRVTHPNVCRIHDIFCHRDEDARSRPGGPPKLTVVSMEYLDGETLAARLARRGRLPSREAVPIAEQIASALAAAHGAGVIHRDLKAHNVMLVKATHGEKAVVTDFGVAVLDPEVSGCEDAWPTGLGLLLGTPAYMAPEQVRDEWITAATDIYALGVLLYEILTGSLPFVGPTAQSIAAMRLSEDPVPPREIVPDLEPWLERVVLRCMEREPGDRFGSAAEVLEALAGKPAIPPTA